MLCFSRVWILFALSVLLATSASPVDPAPARDSFRTVLDQIDLENRGQQAFLRQSYARSLRALKARLQQEGDLDKVTVVLAEIERFNTEKSVPAQLSTLPELRRVQAAYHQQADQLKLTRATRVVRLARQQDESMAAIEKDLVRDGKIDAATTVREQRALLQADPEILAAQDCLARHQAAQPPAPPPTPAPSPRPPAPGSLRAGQWISIPVHADKNLRAGGQTATNGVYWLDTDQTQGRIELHFKDLQLSSLRPKRAAKLRLRIDSHENAASRDRFEVFCRGKLIGTFRGGQADSWIEVGLDPLKLPNALELTLLLVSRGEDGLAVRSRSTGDGPELRIRY